LQEGAGDNSSLHLLKKGAEKPFKEDDSTQEFDNDNLGVEKEVL